MSGNWPNTWEWETRVEAGRGSLPGAFILRRWGVLLSSPPDQKTLVHPFNVRDLLPSQLWQFFRYNGSLTTPPCYQSVVWTVFRDRAHISRAQVGAADIDGGCNPDRADCLFQAP